jgi:hypothetical protein
LLLKFIKADDPLKPVSIPAKYVCRTAKIMISFVIYGGERGI